jgi:hypothetical protein
MNWPVVSLEDVLSLEYGTALLAARRDSSGAMPVAGSIGKESGFKNPPGVETVTLLQPGSEEPRCWWASRETVAQNSYNLASGRYKPQVAEQAPEEDPAELIREVLTLEREIVDGLEKLLKEVEA